MNPTPDGDDGWTAEMEVTQWCSGCDDSGPYLALLFDAECPHCSQIMGCEIKIRR